MVFMGQDYTKSWWAALDAMATVQRYQAGNTLRFQSDGGTNKIGLVAKGQVEAVYFTESGQETWLGQFQAGDLLSHDSLLEGAFDTPELIAVKDTEIYYIQVPKLIENLGGHKSVPTKISQNLAGQIQTLIEKLANVYSLSAKGRICAELVRLSAPIGVNPDKHVIRPNPVFIDLARRLNTTRETVSRTVGDLVKENVLTRTKGALVVNDVERLGTRFN